MLDAEALYFMRASEFVVLNIPVKLIDEINDGFTQIFHAGKLKQGNGLFYFTDFSIHI